jgi:hypothetical protein
MALKTAEAYKYCLLHSGELCILSPSFACLLYWNVYDWVPLLISWELPMCICDSMGAGVGYQ